MKTIEEKNRLIAEFMGHEFRLVKNPTICVDGVSHVDDVATVIDGRLVFTNNLKYHSSWDWLMPVVREIKYSAGVSDEITDTLDNIDNGLMEVSIEHTYSHVIQFIEWYNENRQS